MRCGLPISCGAYRCEQRFPFLDADDVRQAVTEAIVSTYDQRVRPQLPPHIVVRLADSRLELSVRAPLSVVVLRSWTCMWSSATQGARQAAASAVGGFLFLLFAVLGVGAFQ